MNICVVGNGQSPLGHGSLIDGHDFVIRQNSWWLTHPPPIAGRKINAWCWNLAGYLLGHTDPGKKDKPIKVKPPKGPYAVWCTWAYGNAKRTARAYALVNKVLGKRQIVPLNRKLDARLAANLRRAIGARKKVVPTTGIRAVAGAMAKNPELLTLIGFDATLPKRPGWNDKGNPWKKTWGMHSFVAEKRLLAELVDGKVWLGKPTQTKVLWYGRPEDIP